MKTTEIFKPYSAISLFSGAGGMDVGFTRAGFKILWANDFDPIACETYRKNHSSTIECGDINSFLSDLRRFKGVDVVFGGPPCQGFSVAGRMDPTDPRSSLVWSFLDVVSQIRPKIFVMENVKALGVLEKWAEIRTEFMRRAEKLGYGCSFTVLNSAWFGAPQNRERVFFVGVQNEVHPTLEHLFERHVTKTPTVSDTIRHLGRAGNPTNARVCRAKITLAENPVMRKSPYAGMLFNGLGRPLKLHGTCSTLPASMGGNKTPIVDEDTLYHGLKPWVEEYHSALSAGKKTSFESAPERLRRLTIDEAILLQTFPSDYEFAGRNSAIFRQIGNSVPPLLAEAVAKIVLELLSGKRKLTIPQKSGQQYLHLP